MAHVTFTKPAKGDYVTERRKKRKALDAFEKAEKAKVRARDKKCRWPRCDCHTLRLPLEVAHLTSKSIGGASTADQMILLCVSKHQGRPSLHSGDLRIVPLNDAQGTNGPCDFLARDETEGDRFVVVASERIIGVPTTRGL